MYPRYSFLLTVIIGAWSAQASAQSSCSVNDAAHTSPPAVTMALPVDLSEARGLLDRALIAVGQSSRSTAPNVLVTTRRGGDPASNGGMVIKYKQEGGVVRLFIQGEVTRDARVSMDSGDDPAGPDLCALRAVTDSLVRWTGARVEPAGTVASERNSLHSPKSLVGRQ